MPTLPLSQSTERQPLSEQKHSRVHHTVDVKVTADLMQEVCSSYDISAGGMFVDTAQDYREGMVVRLEFELGGQRFDLTASVIHVHSMVGFGARFLDLSPTDRGAILRFVHTERAKREAIRLLERV